jgi:hypothetical protein
MHLPTIGRGNWATRVERASLVAELAALRHAVRIVIFLRLRGLETAMWGVEIWGNRERGSWKEVNCAAGEDFEG